MIHISQFVDRVRAAESRGGRDMVMSLADAKNLHADITKLLLALQALQERAAKPDEVIEVEIVGGKF